MEYVFGSMWFWFGAVAVVAIVGGVVSSYLTNQQKTKRALAVAAQGGDYRKFAEENAELQRRLLERLDALDSRLAAVEKTLTDIPG